MKKLLPFKIRPFNMANFSGGSGYLMFYYVYIMLATYPLYFIISLPLMLCNKIKANPSGEKIQGMLNAKKVKSMLKFIYIPVAAVASVLLTFAYASLEFIYTSAALATVAYFYCAVSPFAVIFTAIMIALKRKANYDGYIKKSEFIGFSLLFILLLSVAAFCIALIFNSLLG